MIKGSPNIQISNGPLYNVGGNDAERANFSPPLLVSSSGQNGLQDVPLTTGDRLKVPKFTIGPESDTDDDSKRSFKESKFSKMGGRKCELNFCPEQMFIFILVSRGQTE